MPRSHQPPRYCLHKASGQAIVTINRRDVYLGPYGSAKSRELYAKLLAGDAVPKTNDTQASVRENSTLNRTVVELLAGFWQHVRTYYVDQSGKANGDHNNFRTLIKRLRLFSGDLLVTEFGPNRLRLFREELIREDLARTTINNRINLVRRIFQWGVGHELVPSHILDALRAVEPLRFGKTTARETEPVRPVPMSWVEAVLPYCSPQLAAMIRLQSLTGMRSGELVIMRTADLVTSGAVWEYAASCRCNVENRINRKSGTRSN